MIYSSKAILPTHLDYGVPMIRAYDEYNIWVDWATITQPRINGQVERANGMVLLGLKPRIFNWLNKFGARRVAELPLVL